MTTPSPQTGKTDGVYLPPDLRGKVDEAESKLKKNGISRSALLSESVREGLDSAVKKLGKRKKRLSLLECVETVVRQMNGDITRARVIEALKKEFPELKKIDAATLSANVASYLRRLTEREVLEEGKQTTAKGEKGFRDYNVNVYRLKK